MIQIHFCLGLFVRLLWAIPVGMIITVPLRAGSNTIRFGNETAFAPDLDRIVISGP
jgi:alpha-galactosidase